jgi:hypothetical protein
MSMDIQSVDMSQANMQEQAAVQVQATEQQQQAQAVDNTIPADPSLGQNVDLTV